MATLRERIAHHQRTQPDTTEAQRAAKERFQRRLSDTLQGVVDRLRSLHEEHLGHPDPEPPEAGTSHG